MGEQTTDGSDNLPPTAAARIDDACEHFMSAWQSGQRPRIEDALEAWPASHSMALLRNLLALELSRRRREGEDPTPAEYLARFPQHRQLVDAGSRLGSASFCCWWHLLSRCSASDSATCAYATKPSPH